MPSDASRFVQLCTFQPGGAPSQQLLALDDEGNVWIFTGAVGWRMWQNQRVQGVGQAAHA